MNRKRNVSYIKPEDPNFLKVLKKQVGYDDKNHKFDKLENGEEDFIDDDESELPQVVVLKKGDLTAEEAEVEKTKLEVAESKIKADLNQRVIFKNKSIQENNKNEKKKRNDSSTLKAQINKKQLLSFDDDISDDDT